MAETTNASTTTNDNDIFQQLEAYPWDTDKEFQGGLSAILGPSPSPSQTYDLTLRAQCFYLSRKRSIPIDFNAYKAYLSNKPISSPNNTITNATMSIPTSTPPPQTPPNTTTETPTSAPDPKIAPYPPTFAQIVQLIQTGAPIPGIREIPDTLIPLEQASKPVLPKRRKPWEKDLDESALEGLGGTFGDQRDIYIVQETPDN